jgi:hypothetical protein
VIRIRDTCRSVARHHPHPQRREPEISRQVGLVTCRYLSSFFPTQRAGLRGGHPPAIQRLVGGLPGAPRHACMPVSVYGYDIVGVVSACPGGTCMPVHAGRYRILGVCAASKALLLTWRRACCRMSRARACRQPRRSEPTPTAFSPVLPFEPSTLNLDPNRQPLTAMALLPAGYGASSAEERATNQERAAEIFRQVALPHLSVLGVTCGYLHPCGGDVPPGARGLCVCVCVCV